VVLDVGCGTGLVTLYASEAAGPEGRVVGLDPTDALLQRARSKSPAHPIEWVHGGVEGAPFGEDTFDVVLCQQALQYMEDPLVGMKAMRRMVKPGGTVAVSIWSPVDTQVPVRDFEGLIARYVSPEVSTIHAFTFGGLERLTSLSSEAGLTLDSAETVSRPTTYDSVAACVELMLGGAGRVLPDGTLGMGLFDLDDRRYVKGVEDLIAALEKQWADYMQGDDLVVPYFTDVVVAHKA
jgi:SAM-dependent methyltransferase